MKKKKLIALIVAILMVFTCIPSLAFAEDATEETSIVASGNCGENLTWTLDADGLLTIFGKGDMYDYSDKLPAPWTADEYKNSLKTLVLEDGITSISSYAFYKCMSFKGELFIPDSVESIGSFAFSSCNGFTGNLVIPDSVKTIEKYAFSRCSGFTGNLVISNSVETIGKYAFEECSGFTGELVIPNSVETIGEYAFSHCEGFTGDLTISEGVVSIGPGAFYYCNGFYGNLSLPNSLTSIGRSAFYECSKFTGDLIIPDSVEYIGEGAFNGCKGFDGKLTLSEGLTEINQSVFASCNGFTGNLVIPNSIKIINHNAFHNCWGLTGNLIIPEGVVSIGSGAFYGCRGFDGTLSLPDNLTSIGSYAFNSCSGFKGDLVIPDNVTSIGMYAFTYCTGFDGKLTLSSGLTSIENGTFEYCWTFTGKLVIPEGIVTIGEGAFDGCMGFNELRLPSTLKAIKGGTVGAFENCTGFTGDLIIPDGVTQIGDEAFIYCSGFNGTLKLPRGLSKIPNSAFADCGFKDIYIPDSVTNIGDSAFFITNPEHTRTFHIFKDSYADKYLSTSYGKKYISEEFQGQKDYLAFKTSTIVAGATATSENVDLASLLISNNEISLANADVVIEDSSVAMYSNGYIIGIYEGECDIIVTVGDQECSARLVVINDEISSATSFSFAKESITMDKGTTTYNQIIKDPAGSDVIIDRWISSDETVATVDKNGIVTSIGPGTTTITAKAGELEASYEVEVGSVYIGVYTLYPTDKYTMIKGEKESLRYYIYPFDTTDTSKVTFESSNEKAVKVTEDGLMKAIAVGTATIKVKKGTVEDSIVVNVNNPIKGISLDKTSIRAYVQDEIQLNLTCEPADHNDEVTPSWTSSDESIATVNKNGLVTITGTGVITITAKVKDFTAECKVTALPMVALESITLDAEEKTIKYNEEFAFTVTKNPKNTTNKKPIIWESSNEDVVTVSEDGKIKGASVGTAVIKAAVKDTTANGEPITAICEVTVEKAIPEYTIPEKQTVLAGAVLSDIELPEGFAWNDETLDVGARGEKTFKATFTPEDTDNYEIVDGIDIPINVIDPKVTAINLQDTLELCVDRKATLKAEIETQDDPEYTVTWSVEDADIAEVDQEGNVIAKSAGETTITVKTSDEMTASCIVTVNEHDYDAVITAPTCTEEGFTTYTCTVCSHEYVSDETDSLGHTPGDAATCMAAQTCTVCGEELVAKLGHDEVSHEAKAPSCTEIGWDAYVTCSRCDYTTYEEKAKLGHDEVSHEAKAPTCTEIGWDAYVNCTRCDYTTYEEKAKLGHDEVSHEAKAPTCTEIGWDAYVDCTRCDYTTYEEKAKLDHDYVDHEGKPATCDELGWKAYQTCSRCDYTTYEAINALGHTYTNYIINNDSTCQKNATKTAICDNGCGTTDTRIAEGTMSNCRYGDWIIIKEPTKTEAGLQKRSCIWCGDVQTISIPATGVYINEENFPDPEFRRALIEHYAQDEEGDDTILTPIELSEINSFYNNSDEYAIKDLTGIHLLTSLTYLDIAYSTLIKHIPLLPDSIEEIRCDETSVVSFEKLPASLTRLSVQEGALTSLPELPEGLEDLWISENKLTSLPELPESLVSLSCWDNQLTELPELPKHLEELNCDGNKLKNIPKLPNGLKEFSCTDNELTSLQDLPDTVIWFRCYENQLTALPKLSKNLTELYAGYNQISGELDVSDLQYLSVIEVQDNFITSVKLCEDAPYKQITLYGNAIKSLADVTGVTGIPWDEDYEFQFEEQTKLCQIYDHAYEVISTIEATCTKAGRTHKKCSVCSEEVTEYSSATDHSWNDDYTTDKEATCTGEGVKSIHCSKCSATKDTKPIDKLPHDYKKTVTPPTCTEAGYTTYTCTCGDTYQADEVAATGHTLGEFKTTKKAGFGKEGEQEATCAVCQQTVTRSIAAAVIPVISDQTFNNKNKTPKITVKNTDGNKVTIKTPYFYNKTRKSVGKYKVKVTLRGNDYSGYKYVYFKINPKGTSISKLSKAKKSFTVKWKKQSGKMAKSRITGYQYRYSTSSKMTNPKTVTVKGYSKTSAKKTGLKAKKKYYVQVRTYKTVSGTKYYSPWSKTKSVTTK